MTKSHKKKALDPTAIESRGWSFADHNKPTFIISVKDPKVKEIRGF